MSGENIYNLLPPEPKQYAGEGATGAKGSSSPYTGKYKKRLDEQSKPTYSTFWERGKEYDGSHPHFFKQRDAIIGPSVADSVDPKSYLKKGGGVRHVVPPIHDDKMFTKPPVDHSSGYGNAFGGGANNGTDDRDGNGANNGTDGGDGNGASRYQMSGDGAADGSGNLDGLGAMGGGADGIQGTYGSGLGAPFGGYKDFVTSNIVEISNMVPKRRKDQPDFATSKKDFGKTPAYLERVKGEIQEEKDFVRSLETRKEGHREHVISHYVYQLSEAERKELVAKLQKKLEEKTSMYNKIPFSKDTLETAKRKGELERGIKEIEEALKKLDREAIFIYKDDPVNGQWTRKAAMEAACKFASKN